MTPSRSTAFWICSLLFALACGRTDFDPNSVPDGGTDGGNSDVEGCGNGRLELKLGEECDNGADNSNEPNAVCRLDCSLARCGDGIVDSDTEECDDAQNNSNEPGANCRTNCRASRCGDGILDPGEGCDEGGLNSDDPGSNCRTNCRPPGCGDGVKDPSEECDDGNEDETDACTNACKNATCGDGIVWDGVEVCDDGNQVSDIFCSADCQSSCGDGVLARERGEVCDDGDLNSDTEPSRCRTDCRPASCGDTVFDPGQFCLSTPEFLPTSGAGVEATEADLNDDGRTDLVLVSNSAVTTYIQTDEGFVQSFTATVTGGTKPLVGDFNGDALPDLVVIETTLRRVAFFPGQGGVLSTFGPPIRTSIGVGFNASRGVKGYFDGDNTLDLALLVPFGNQLRLMLNTGSGGFTSRALQTCQRPQSIAIGSFNPLSSTGNDLAVVCAQQNLINILQKNGDGTFTESYYSAINAPTEIKVSDVNRDGRDDLVVLKRMAHPSPPEVMVYLQEANGSFSQGTPTVGITSQVLTIQVADADRDGDPDLLVVEQTNLKLFSNDGSGLFTLEREWDYRSPNSLLFADLDGDYHADFVLPSETPQGFLLSLDDISLQLPPRLPLGDTAQFGVAGDFDADGESDAALVGQDQVLLARGDGTGAYNGPNAVNAPGIRFLLLLGSAVFPDMAMVFDGTQDVQIQANPGGVLSADTPITTGGDTPVAALSGLDLNGDTQLDGALLYANNTLAVIMGGVLPETTSIAVGASPVAFASGTLDAGSTTDFVVLDGDGQTISAVLNNTPGAFVVLSLGTLNRANPDALALLDVDNDGSVELVAAYAADQLLEVYTVNLNDPPSLTFRSMVGMGCGPMELLVGDHDQDGQQDLIALCGDALGLRWVLPENGDLVVFPQVRTLLSGATTCFEADIDGDATGDLLCAGTSLSALLTRP